MPVQQLPRRQVALRHQVAEGRNRLAAIGVGCGRPGVEGENACACHAPTLGDGRDSAGHCGTFDGPALTRSPVRRSLPVLAFLLFLSPALHAQQASAGASYTLLSLTYPDQMPNGFGGWFSWDLATTGPTFGIDAGVNFFPEDHPLIGRQTQVLAGVRGGVRTDHLALFARVRPGFVHFSRRFFQPEIACVLIFPPPESCLIDATNLAFDLGGTVEVYPTARATLRFDLGDTVLRFARTDGDSSWRHNLQFAAGAGWRF